MARNTSGLRRGGPGRPKGSKNKTTKAMQEWAEQLFESEEWRKSARQRMLSGKAPHLEGHIMACVMPKPKDAGDTDRPGRLLVGWLSE